MTGLTARRFWQQATVAATDGGWKIMLDARELRTPAKARLCLPNARMAEAVAAEWNAVKDTVSPNDMPVTRRANSAIDKLASQRPDVIDLLAEYVETDLLCYRAEAPAELRARQDRELDPLIAWFGARHGIALSVHSGVMPRAQVPAARNSVLARLSEMTDFELVAAHDLIAISGSAVLGLAVCEGHVEAAEAFRLSRIEEAWQAEHWGIDDEAMRAEAMKLSEFRAAERFLELARDSLD